MTEITGTLVNNIQELICLIDNDFDNFKGLLDQIIADVIKNPKHLNAFTSFINNQLSNSHSRKHGLILLKNFVPLCPNEIVTENAIAWLNNSLKFCEDETEIQDEAFTVIKPLLELCHGTPELNKSVTSGILSKIIETITKINYKSRKSNSALQCLETCLRVYAGPCTPFKTTIDKFLLAYIDCSDSPSIIRTAGKCLHASQQIGGGGAQGVNHKQAWKKQQLSLCATIHCLMDKLFESITEFGFVQQENATPLQLPQLPEGDETKIQANRIINTIGFLQEMLLGAYPTAKCISPSSILSLISRGLAVTSSTLGEHIVSDLVNISSHLYFIHKQLLQLLQSLIICLGCNLIPYATVICKMVINNLKCTAPKNANNVQSFCDLRVTAYQTLFVWLTTAKTASCVHIFAETLIPILVEDITPIKNEINLTIQNNTPKHLSKKARKKLQQEQVTQSYVAKTYSPILKKELSKASVCQIKICSEALNVVQSVLHNTGYLLKPVIHKQLQEFVVKTIFDLQRGINLQPYDNVNCKIELYKTLTSLVTNHHYSMTPPLQYAILLLAKGQTEIDPRISSVCTTAISNLNTFIHPPFATLQFPLYFDEIKDDLRLGTDKQNIEPIFKDNEEGEMEIDESDTQKVDEKCETVTESNEQADETKDGEVEVKENGVNDEAKTDELKTNGVEKAEEQVNEEGTKNAEEVNDCNEDVMEVPVTKKMKTIESPKSCYSVQIEILSDDEVMEQLTIEDEPENAQEDEATEKEKAKKVEEKKDSNEHVIDLVDEDMCSAFVDIVNE